MNIIEQIVSRYRNAEVRRGGVYLVNEDVGQLCQGLVTLIRAQGIPAFHSWETGLSLRGGYQADVTCEMVVGGLERDRKLKEGGVSLVELRHQDFGLFSIPRLQGVVMAETMMQPKRMLVFLTESLWIAGALNYIVEDMRGE